jgi:hypothetical protein
MADPVNYDVRGYEAFQARAQDRSLSDNQKAGFPDAVRNGRSEAILADIATKLPALNRAGAAVLDIGPGCGELARCLIQRTGKLEQRLTLIDGHEVLARLPQADHVRGIDGPFPACLARPIPPIGLFSAILAYSVAQYVFAEANLFGFIDEALKLLDEDGALLIGDLPNTSMRKRFLASPSGRRHHAEYYAGLPCPEPSFNALEPGHIDDSVVLGVVARARAAGFQAFVVPQARELPMANRREDILIRRP